MQQVTKAAIDHPTTGRRRRRGAASILVVVTLVAATLTAVVAAPTAPVAADGNEAPGAPLAARSLTAGGYHTCAILPSGAVKCWGSNSRGQLGYDSTTTFGDNAGEMAALPPVNLGAGRTATSITAGDEHTCALLDNATVRCWGRGDSGRLGQDSTAHLGDQPGEMAALPPVNLGAGRTATAITAGNAHTCALLDNATVKCWGHGAYGQLGQDSTANLGDQPGEMAALAAVNLGAGRTATSITAGDTHTCALLDNATVKCWGNGSLGRLGQDSGLSLGDQPGEMAALPPVNLGAGRTATAITAGGHTCALLDNATVKCWGYGADGRLGQDSTDTLGDNAGEMAALAAVNLGVPLQLRLTAGEPYVEPGEVIHYHLTITNNSASTLTGVTIADPNAPDCAQAVPDLPVGQVVTINCSYTAVGGDHPSRANAATVDTDQTSPTASNTVNVPVGFPLTTVAAAITTGTQHTCALLDNATVKCWGLGDNGQLGQDSTTTLGDDAGEMALLQPVNLGVGRTATAITAGSSHTCALLDNATVKCWGNGADGRLGQDSTANLGDAAGEMAALAAVNLGAGRTATAITAGGRHTCALLDNATVKCWGAGFLGRLGQGSTTTLGDEPGEMAALAPVNLGAGRTATAVAAGGSHTCALLDNATVKCWGWGILGQLGHDSTDDRGDQPGEMAALPPVNLGAGRTATAITAGNAHTCALLDNATVKCWGEGVNGQLGQDSTTTLGNGMNGPAMAALPAVNLGAGRTATAIAAGGDNTCALLDNATVKCWGYGANGQLGQDSTATLGDSAGEMAALAAVNLGAGRTATAITAGGHTCALLDNATVKCWGYGADGRLGQDSTDTLGDNPGEMAALAPILLGVGPPAPGLSVTKSADETTVAVGATIHLHVTVANTGNVALNDVTIDDPNGPDCEAAPFDLAVGADQTVDCTHAATTASVAGGYHNTASVTADEVTTAVVSNTVDVTVTVPPGGGLVGGTITETGSANPIPGAVVALLDTATYAPVAVATANAAGQYAAAPAAGTYLVYAIDTTGAHTPGFSGAPTSVVVTAGNTTTANASLAAARGTLAGTVTDTGGPVAGVLAMSVDLGNGQPGAGDLTDNAGAYTIGGIAAGSRLLEFIDLSATHTVEFYDNVPTPAGAQVLTISGAATTTANAQLATQTASGTTAHLTGQITSTVGGNLEGVAVFAARTSDFGLAAGALTDASGNYDIALDPGTYKLAFYDPTGTHLFEWHDNQPASGLGSAATVTATAGTPLATNAALTPTTGTVSGAVTETGTNANLGNVFVVAINPSGVVVGGTTTAANGTYTLTNLSVGNIRIRFVDLNAAHTDEYYDNSPDFAGGTLIPITAGGATTGINAALTSTGG